MKKILVIISALALILAGNCRAKTMPSSTYLDDYSFVVRTTSTSSAVVKKISNSEYQYYITDALNTYWDRKDYMETDSNLNTQELNYLSKISFYSNDDILKQYIMFKYFNDVSISIKKNKIGDVTSEYLEKEKELKEIVNSKKFSLEDSYNVDDNFIIEDEYIINNFIPTSDKIIYEDSTIKFITDDEEVNVDFIPKYNCNEVKMYHNETNPDLIGFKRNIVCEHNYSVTFKRNIKSENPVENMPSIPVFNNNNNYSDSDNKPVENNDDKIDIKDDEIIMDNNIIDSNDSNEYKIVSDGHDYKKQEEKNKVVEKTSNDNYQIKKVANDLNELEKEEKMDNQNNNIEESTYETLKKIKANVPETYKNSKFPFIFLILLGTIVYGKKH